jgi:hypothetical protein
MPLVCPSGTCHTVHLLLITTVTQPQPPAWHHPLMRPMAPPLRPITENLTPHAHMFEFFSPAFITFLRQSFSPQSSLFRQTPFLFRQTPSLYRHKFPPFLMFTSQLASPKQANIFRRNVHRDVCSPVPTQCTHPDQALPSHPLRACRPTPTRPTWPATPPLTRPTRPATPPPPTLPTRPAQAPPRPTAPGALRCSRRLSRRRPPGPAPAPARRRPP